MIKELMSDPNTKLTDEFLAIQLGANLAENFKAMILLWSGGIIRTVDGLLKLYTRKKLYFGVLFQRAFLQ